MNGKTLLRAVRVLLVLALATATSMLAQDPRPEHFSGVINDFTPITGGTTAYEVHGPWSLSLDHDTGKAHFSASLTMELSVLGQSAADVQTGNLAQHTHNITMDGTVIYDPTDCPPAASTTPPYVARIEINGTASVFANGSTAPFGNFHSCRSVLPGEWTRRRCRFRTSRWYSRTLPQSISGRRQSTVSFARLSGCAKKISDDGESRR